MPLKTSKQKKYVSVQQGEMRGKKILLPPAIHGHRHFTSALIKEALFQICEPYKPAAFFDLCAGSAQIAVEALSRGFSPVHCVERDDGRFSFLVEQLKGIDIILHKKDFRRMASVITCHSVVFLDVPYSFWQRDGSCELIEDFLVKLLENSKLSILLAIQSPTPISFKKEKLQNLLEQGVSRDYRGHTLFTVEIN
ncbi:MAG: RsmD family RNA methyltransferase [Leptonema sp. (in: Bacteria)]|nr:RsmD family RNA methyltransferase [Leptonema sp. (in: bacteria)]